MKRSDLRAKFNEAGIEADKVDELVNFVMDANGKDINSTKTQFETELNEANAKVEELTKANSELTTKNDSYKDSYKDYEELKAFKENYQAEQEKNMKADFLKSIGCKHPELIESQIDWTKAAYDKDKKTYTGLEETVKSLKESYKDMFEEAQKVEDKFNPNLQSKGEGESDFMKAYKQSHPNLDL